MRWPGQRPRRLGAPRGKVRLGDLGAARVAWTDREYFGNKLQRERVDITTRDGRSFTVARSPTCNFDCSVVAFGPRIDGRSLYWAYEILCGCGRPISKRMVRLTPRRPRWCRSSGPRFSGRGFDEDGVLDFAVARRRIDYVANRGVFQVRPTRVHWSRPHCALIHL